MTVPPLHRGTEAKAQSEAGPRPRRKNVLGPPNPVKPALSGLWRSAHCPALCPCRRLGGPSPAPPGTNNESHNDACSPEGRSLKCHPARVWLGGEERLTRVPSNPPSQGQGEGETHKLKPWHATDLQELQELICKCEESTRSASRELTL